MGALGGGGRFLMSEVALYKLCSCPAQVQGYLAHKKPRPPRNLH